MRAAYRSQSYSARPSRRSRATASALSLAIMAAVVLALLWITAAQFVDMGDQGVLATFDVASGERPKTATRQQAAKAQPKRPRTPPPPRTRAPPPPVPLPTVPSVLTMSREDFAASDIGAMRAPEAATGAGTEVADSGGGSTYGPSEVPGGRTLHNADWYREPTRAEMATYMPPRQQVGWGMIACQTAERFRVENCRVLGETPGSGISRGMRLAAWQFLVRPPQVNGKPQIGAWVRIRFDLIQGIVK